MVKVNNLQLLTVYVLQFVINDKTLHLLFSSYHWECRSGSGHRHKISSGGDGIVSYDTNVNVPVSTNGFSLVFNVDFSFPCRNWFPRKICILSMPDGNSTWLRIVFFCECGEMLCVEQLCSEVLTWNCCCWVFSVIRVRLSAMHIFMDV